METKIEIPDSLYPELAAASSAEGLSVEAFVMKAAREKLCEAAYGGNGAAKVRVEHPNQLGSDHPLAGFLAHLDSLSDEKCRELLDTVQDVQSNTEQESSRIESEHTRIAPVATGTIAEHFGDVFGSMDSESVNEVQKVIDEEFSRIDPEDWK